MARLPYIDPAAAPAELQPLIEQIERERGGRVLNLYRMLLHSPPIAAGWLKMGTAVRYQAKLDGRIRELAICAVARLNGAAYEYHHHAPLARREGVSEAQLAALLDWRTSHLFDDRERAALAYTEAMTRQIEVPDDTFATVREHFDEQETVELTATIAFYNLVSRFLVALRIDID